MTREKLRTLFRSLIDDAGSTSVFSDTRVNALLFEGAQQIQDIIEGFDEKYFTEIQTNTVDAAVTTISIGTNCRQVLEVKRVEPEPHIAIRQVDMRQLVQHRREYNSNEYSPVFAIDDASIRYPSGMGINHKLEIYKTIQLEDLEQDDQEWTKVPAAAQRLIAYEAVLIGLVSEDSDASQFERLTNRMRENFIINMDRRGRTGPDMVNYSSEEGSW